MPDINIKLYKAISSQTFLGKGMPADTHINFSASEQSRGIITVITKQGKDPSFLKNLRLITLLNCDYKIGAKVIANRLKLVLPSIISPS